jgi:methylmalonyl-CoA/ethylmalonyl-CoA epimerase
MPMALDHVGIATEDAAGLAERFGAVFETQIAHSETFDGMYIIFLDMNGTYLELLEPVGDSDGPIATFLAQRDAGIHHIAIMTEDIATALENARAVGIECIDETPRQGAWGHQVAFLHPRSTGGVLCEFVQQ